MSFNKDFGDHLTDGYINELIQRFEQVVKSGDAVFFEEEELEDIIDFFEERHETDNALFASQIGITQYPFSAWFLVKQGQFYFQEKRHDLALDMLDKAEILDHSELEIYFLRADIYSFLGRHPEAVQSLESALPHADTEDMDVLYVYMADVYDAAEQFDNAYTSLKKALELKPDNEDALYKLWFVVDITERYAESVSLHEEIINKTPYSHQAWYNLGQAYMGMAQYEKAAEAFEYVVLIEEENEMAYRDWAESLYRQSQFKEALAVLESANKVVDPYEEIYFSMALCHEKLGDTSRARYFYRKALQLDPRYDEAFFRIAELYKKDERLKEALVYYKKALKINEEHTDYLSAYADACYLSDMADEAVTAYKLALQQKPAAPVMWLQLAQLLLDKEDKEGALHAVDEAIGHCGTLGVFLYARSGILLQSGARNEGFIALEEALSLDAESYGVIAEYYESMEADDEVMALIGEYR